MWTMMMTMMIAVAFGVVFVVVHGSVDSGGIGKCEPIKADLCKTVGYNMTRMPNLAQDSLQADAIFQLATFVPLIQSGCSSELQFFLCSVYVPMCVSDAPTIVVEQQAVIGPCRPLCLKVRNRCEPKLRELGLGWPPSLNCSNYPAENNDKHMCMQGPGENSTNSAGEIPISSLDTFQTNPIFRKKVREHFSHGFDDEKYNSYKEYIKLFEGEKPAPSVNSECGRFKKSSGYRYVRERCIPECLADINFTTNEKTFSEVWIAIWGTLAFASTLFTLTSYALLEDPQRFRFPERSVIFVTLCFFVYSGGYLLRLVLGREAVSCQPDDDDPRVLLLTREGLRNENCVIVFLCLYYPLHAATAWWTVATLSWLLSSITPKKDVNVYSPIYHLYAWGVPAAQTIAVLVLHKLDANELTGTCYVGSQDDYNFLLFEVVPQTLQLVLSTVFFLLGIIFSILNTNQKRKVFSRIGVFWVLYSLPKFFELGCSYYIYNYRSEWVDISLIEAVPNVEIFMLGIFMSLIIGITTGYWIWSQKTWLAWKHFGSSVLGFWKRKKKPPTPTFPTVRYAPQPSGEVVDHSGNISLEMQPARHIIL